MDARDLLRTLASGDKITVDGLVRTVAVNILRHYPHDPDIAASAAALPSLWCEPKHRQQCSASTADDSGRVGGRGNFRLVRIQGADRDQ
ncbi:BPSL0761 family protein [Paraburkholderia sp. SIMBA_027]|uniref:BPSL0761 family protein n=1 Tax=Paraburkholderia sp. SIMBA_027 TaxID=3085770 RepID=UPI00397BA53A